MEITEVRVSLVGSGNSKLKAFANITFDDAFVVRDLKIIEGRSGLFVAMPGTCAKAVCPRCGRKNPVRDLYCGACGIRLPQRDLAADAKEEFKDIAHPITARARDYVENKVLEAYHSVSASPQPAPQAAVLASPVSGRPGMGLLAQRAPLPGGHESEREC